MYVLCRTLSVFIQYPSSFNLLIAGGIVMIPLAILFFITIIISYDKIFFIYKNTKISQDLNNFSWHNLSKEIAKISPQNCYHDFLKIFIDNKNQPLWMIESMAINQAKKFEKKLAEFLQYEDVITFSSCFSANGGVFASLLDENDAIISADLNHASLIDGIRLCKAHRYFYKYNDMAELEKKLQEEEDSKYLFHIGAYMRWNDAIIPVAKIEFGSIAIATSYDANISQLKRNTRGQGGFEISLTYQKAKQANSSLDAARCPKF